MTLQSCQLESVGLSSNPTYCQNEERLNVITHAIGFLAASLGLVYLLIKASTPIATLSSVVYGASLMLVFLTSTLYHFAKRHSLKQFFKLLDHSAIYLLIAGTYTPFMLVSLNNWMGIVGAAVIWSIALLGLLFKWFAGQRFPKISIGLYLLMGWLIVILIYPLCQVVPEVGLWLLLAGGIFFSLGVVFYVKKEVRFTHSIWHCFVNVGCACHFFSIYRYVL